jgi:hypothetical protein
VFVVALFVVAPGFHKALPSLSFFCVRVCRGVGVGVGVGMGMGVCVCMGVGVCMDIPTHTQTQRSL